MLGRSSPCFGGIVRHIGRTLTDSAGCGLIGSGIFNGRNPVQTEFKFRLELAREQLEKVYCQFQENRNEWPGIDAVKDGMKRIDLALSFLPNPTYQYNLNNKND
jgi:hypothetical protein